MTHTIRYSHDIRFEHYADTYNKFQKIWTDFQLGTSPFESRDEFDWFKQTHKLSKEVRNRLKEKYYSDYKDRKEQFIDDMERRAISVLGGGYIAAKTEQYRTNLLGLLDTWLKHDNPTISYLDLSEYTKTLSALREQGKSVSDLNKLGPSAFGDKITTEKITLKQFRNMIKNMSLVELNRFSSLKEIAPDFRAYGSGQEQINTPEISNISMLLNQLSFSTEAYLLKKYSPQEITNKIIYQTLPVAVKKHAKGKSQEELENEKWWYLFKHDRLYTVSSRGNVYIPFVNRQKQKDIMDYIANRLADEGE